MPELNMLKRGCPRITLPWAVNRFLILLFIMGMVSCLPRVAWAQEDESFKSVGEWLDANEITYTVVDSGTYAVAFEAENIERIDILIDFSDDFVHFSVPIGFVPEDAGEDYLWDIITTTGPAPMIKPVIDEERFFFLALDLPKAALSEEELMNDLLMMVNFTDMNIAVLTPDIVED